MSDIKRYEGGRDSFGMSLVEHDPNGEYVRYADHIAAMEVLKGVSSQGHEARIKALEKLSSMVEYHNRQVDRLDSHMIEAETRLMGLEQALNEHMVKEREKTKTASDEGMTEAFGVGWNTIIDPKASPAGIPFEVALAYVKAGREVRRAKWQPNTLRVEPRGPGGVGGLCMVYGASLVQGDFIPNLADLLANDWMVLPEKS